MSSEGQGSASSHVRRHQHQGAATAHLARSPRHSCEEGQPSAEQHGAGVRQEDSSVSLGLSHSSPESISINSRAEHTSSSRRRSRSSQHPSEQLHHVLRGEEGEQGAGGGVAKKKARSGPRGRTSPFIGVSQVKSTAKVCVHACACLPTCCRMHAFKQLLCGNTPHAHP